MITKRFPKMPDWGKMEVWWKTLTPTHSGFSFRVYFLEIRKGEKEVKGKQLPLWRCDPENNISLLLMCQKLIARECGKCSLKLLILPRYIIEGVGVLFPNWINGVWILLSMNHLFHKTQTLQLPVYCLLVSQYSPAMRVSYLASLAHMSPNQRMDTY